MVQPPNTPKVAPDTAREEPEETQEAPWRTRLVRYAFTTGLAAIVPIPLLDDWIFNRQKRRMVWELARRHGVTLSRAEVLHLSGTESKSTWGCLIGIAFGLVFKITVKLIRRVFRSILFFLLAKDAGDAASKTFHEGHLLNHAFPRLREQLNALEEHGLRNPGGDAGGRAGTPALPREIQHLRKSIVLTCRDTDTRPLEKSIKSVFKGARSLLRSAGRAFGKAARAERDGAEQDVTEGVRDQPGNEQLERELERALEEQSGYLAELEASFDRHWA